MGKQDYFIERIGAYVFIAFCLWFILFGWDAYFYDNLQAGTIGKFLLIIGIVPLVNEIIVFIRDNV